MIVACVCHLGAASALVAVTGVTTMDRFVTGWSVPPWQLVLRDFVTTQARRNAVSYAHHRAARRSGLPACLPTVPSSGARY